MLAFWQEQIMFTEKLLRTWTSLVVIYASVAKVMLALQIAWMTSVGQLNFEMAPDASWYFTFQKFSKSMFELS